MNTAYANRSALTRRDMMVMGGGAVGAALTTSKARAQTSGAFTNSGLARLAAAAQGPVDRSEVAGMVTLIAAGGDIVVTAVGVQDLETRVPMQRDTIFRIASARSIQAPVHRDVIADGCSTDGQSSLAGAAIKNHGRDCSVPCCELFTIADLSH